MGDLFNPGAEGPVAGRQAMPLLRLGGAIGGYFALKIAIGLMLLFASAQHLSLDGFVIFSQLFLFLALLATLSAGGLQIGLIRQIAAAGDDLARERRSTAAALLIWGALSAAAILLGFALRGPIAVLLLGSTALAWAIPGIAAAAVGGGAGIVLCSVLTGRGRAPTSLALQAVGLAVGGLASLWRLYAGDPAGAVAAYAAGPLLAALLALPFTSRWLPAPGRRSRNVGGEVRVLLGYSGAFLINASLIPATLFALRYAYRLEFGTEALGYWLAANRVSDVTTQLLGLYMSQVFLPLLSRPAGRRTRSILLWTFLAATLLMASGWLLFLLGARFFVTTFLAAQFLPAIPFIAGYLAGDILRVSASMALHAALARGRLLLYVGIEAATAALLAAFVLGAIAAGRPDGAWLGYIATYGTMSLLVWGFALRRLKRE